MSYQLFFMIPATLVGVVGSFVSHPFLGVAVYYLFAVLRPQFIWEWSLPQNIAWSWYVAIATILSTLAWKTGLLSFDGEQRTKLTVGHYGVIAFAVWITVTHFNALHPDISEPYFIEYVKIFIMFIVSAYALNQTKYLWHIFLLVTLTLCYIAYEVNFEYFFHGHYAYLSKRGYGGLDNNGAALMLAMGVPLCIYIWDGMKGWKRWVFVAFIPVIIHAVLTSYSRGAMLSLLLSVPIYLLRCRHRLQLLSLLMGVALTLPFLAGKEIRERFFSIEQHDIDESATSRKNSWVIGWRMAQERPIFGFGIRNSNHYTFLYGADKEGRTIHSQYLQIAADSGLVGLAAYLFALGGFFFCNFRLLQRTRARNDPDAERIHALACGTEGAMIVFCIGAAFLALETFELPYMMMLLGAQGWSLWSMRDDAASNDFDPRPIPNEVH
jgi:probable O-glycosylation ligase (exosortase A-associated)